MSTFYHNLRRDEDIRNTMKQSYDSRDRRVKICAGKLTAFCMQRSACGVLALIFLISFGCASVPVPPQNAERNTQYTERSLTQNAVRSTQNTDSVAALVALLEKKNVISADEAARFTQNAVRGTQNADSVTALVALLEKKNVISADEAASFTQNAVPSTQYAERLPAQNAELSTRNADIRKITANVTEELRKNIQEQVKTEVSQELPVEMKKVEQAAAAPAWTQRVRFGGDIRLRYENDRFDKNNAAFAQPSNPAQILNSTVNQELFKYRVRIGAEMDVNDQLEAVVRLSTGNTTNPVSTNSILGTYFNKDNVLFDLAYLRWKPSEFITMYGGRIPNPWFYSDLVWSRDLNFEGLALNVRKHVTDSLIPFFTAGAFPLQQTNLSTRSKWLYAGQLGVEEPDPKGIAYKLGAAYYYYSNITGIANNPLGSLGATNWTAPLFQQKGNTLFDISGGTEATLLALASEFKELNFTGNLDIGLWDPYHIVLLGDFVKNIGFNANDVSARAGIPNVPEASTIGYQVGLSVGHPVVENFGQWKLYLNYKYLESDAVVDAFTDPDFHLGGTNARGWILGTDFGVMKNTWFTLRWLSAKQISGPPLAIDVLQVDLNAKF